MVSGKTRKEHDMANEAKAALLRDLAALIDGHSDKGHSELLNRLEAEGMAVKAPSARWPDWRVDMAGVRGKARLSKAAALENWAKAARRAALKLEG